MTQEIRSYFTLYGTNSGKATQDSLITLRTSRGQMFPENTKAKPRGSVEKLSHKESVEGAKHTQTLKSATSHFPLAQCEGSRCVSQLLLIILHLKNKHLFEHLESCYFNTIRVLILVLCTMWELTHPLGTVWGFFSSCVKLTFALRTMWELPPLLCGAHTSP